MSFAVTAKLICIFVFAYTKCWFSHDGAQMLFINSKIHPLIIIKYHHVAVKNTLPSLCFSPLLPGFSWSSDFFRMGAVSSILTAIKIKLYLSKICFELFYISFKKLFHVINSKY